MKKILMCGFNGNIWDELNALRQSTIKNPYMVIKYNPLCDFLALHGYLTTTDDAFTFIATDKFKNTKDVPILEDITGKTFIDILKEKTIEPEMLPYDFDEIIDALKDNHTLDLNNALLDDILRFHGFVVGAGPNGYHSVGTPKTNKYSFEQIFKTITSVDYNDFLAGKHINVTASDAELNTLFELAEKLGYNLTKKD